MTSVPSLLRDRMPPRGDGVPFVLTASRAEMATFGNSWMKAMMSTFPEALVRLHLQKYFRPANERDGRAKFAPYGLRKVEAVLSEQYGEKNVAVVHPSNLDLFVGRKTQVVGVSTMDPLGLAYVSMTYNPMIGFGGPSVDRVEFIRLMRHRVFSRFKPKKIVGGFGVWQIRDANLQESLGIDHLISGECDLEIVPIIEKLRKEEPCPKYIRTRKVYDYERIPIIRNASAFGTVEITRGCGRRCQFCSPDYRTKYDFPVDSVMKEVQVNVDAGCSATSLVTEDIFLYGQSPNFVPSRAKLSELLRTIARHPSVDEIAISHASITPVVVDPGLLEEITPLFIEKSHYHMNGRPYVAVDVGIESGSTRIMKKYMGGKGLPYRIEEWPEIVVQGTGIMNDNDWFPMYTFILGLPGEREEDALASLELLDRLRGYTIFLVPLLFIPLEDAVLRNANRATLDRMTELHWEFLIECWKRNLKLWTKHLDPIVRVTAFFAYGLYLRRLHGTKSFKPMMRLIGWPGIRGPPTASWKHCDRGYCFGKRSELNPGYSPAISEMKCELQRIESRDD